MIELFAIQHIPTGNFLPATATGRGGTHVEPIEPSPATLPRLFHTEHAAKIALTYWLKGVISKSQWYSWEGEYEEDLHTEPKPERKREDMIIVPVQLYYPC